MKKSQKIITCNLKAITDARGLDAHDVVMLTGVTINTIYSLLKNTHFPSRSVSNKLINGLNISHVELFDTKEN